MEIPRALAKATSLMSIKSRLLFGLGVLLLAFLATIYAFRRAEREQVRRLVEQVSSEGRQQLGRWLQINALPLRQFIYDFSQRSDSKPAGPSLWQSALTDYNLDAIWVFDANGQAVTATARDATQPPPAAPNAQNMAEAYTNYGVLDFYQEDATNVWHFYGTRLPHTDTREETGWLLAAIRLDSEWLTRLSLSSGAKIQLAPVQVSFARDDAPPVVEWAQTLADIRGQPLRELRCTRATDETTALLSDDGNALGLFLSFGLLVMTALTLAVRRWVLRPLTMISQSLTQRDPAPIRPLLAQRDEFAPVARLVEAAFADQAELERQIAERRRAEEKLQTSEADLRDAVELRSRLARDLHDTVIQSIYAAGLGLESVRNQLAKYPAEADERVRHCMDSLNDTIRQIRRYINDLEPDATIQPRQQFAAAVRALTTTMRELWPVEFVLSFNEAIAARLTNVVQMHALQIVRECISNALRHGKATRIAINLEANGPGAGLFEVRDNGAGFDPATAPNTGRGLPNLAHRAREMGAALRIESKPGRGTRISLHLPLMAEPTA